MKKNLIIAGASGNLGIESVKFFLEKDYDAYYLISRRKIEIAGSFNKNIKQIIADDLTNENEVKKSFEQITFESSSNYFLFSTVGGYYGGKEAKDIPYEEWLKMLNVNLNSAFLFSKYFIQNVKDTKGGSICFTGALSGFTPQRNITAYGTSKNALHYLVETLALESKKYGISVNAAAPYVIDSKESREWIKDETQLISPQNIAGIVHIIFENYKIINGNIFKLGGTIK